MGRWVRVALACLWMGGGCAANVEPDPSAPDAADAARVELGRRLFYDERLSRDVNQACASCHVQALAFTDGKGRAVGSTGEVLPRGAPTLANVADAKTLTWMNPVLRDLDQQALVPLFGERPVELGLVGVEDEVLLRLHDEPRYPALFHDAFPDPEDPISFHSVINALAAFERTIVSSHAPYDAVLAGDEGALDVAQRRGMDLFFSDRLRCGSCHSGKNLTDGEFHNTALYDEDGEGAYPDDNRGLIDFTGEPADMGKFRTATLRNVAITAPYMHDGSIDSLDGVIDHYAAGGRTHNQYKSENLVGFTLTSQERNDLLAFLEALTDETFLIDSALSDPW